MSRHGNNRNRLMLTSALGGALLAISASSPVVADDDHDDGHGGGTATPIKHVIVLIGENRSFDNVFGMYRPRPGRSVSNLLTKGIVNASGMTVLNTPGPLSQGQGPFNATVPDSQLPRIEPSLEFEDLGLLRTGASGLPMFTEDTRVDNAS